MNRADFLKRLGLGAIGIAVAPKVISEVREAPLKAKRLNKKLWHNVIWTEVEPLCPEKELPETDTYCDCYTAEPYDCIMSEDFIKADRAWHDHVLDEVFLGKTMG
jgi:hypothetical protein